MVIQPKTTPAPCTILCLGDSQTMTLTNAVRPEEYWPGQLQIQALTAGYALDCINAGNSGWTTTQLLAIALDRITRFKPSVLVFYAGVNDPGNGISGATTQANIQSVIDIALANGVQYVLVVNTNYLNFATGGDNVGTSTYYATYQTLRTYQAAAVTAAQGTHGASAVGLGDLFTYQAGLVTAGTWTQGNDAQTQIAKSNQHMNAYAQDDTATYILSALVSAGVLAAYTIQ